MKSLLVQVWARPDEQPAWTLSEWETVLGQARQARLLGRLARHYADHHWLMTVPKQPRLYLEGALRLIERQHHEVQWEALCIRRALMGVDTPVVMLKGAAYFVAGLPPRHGRLFSDIDIMVEKERLPEVEGALFRHGWISEERDAYNQRYYREWMHEIPPMTHVQRGTVIDVHHTITPPTSRFKVDGARLLERAVAIDGWEGVYVLAPVDMVLHSAVHLFQEGEFSHGLRDLLDINDLLLHFGTDPGFWGALFARARDLGLGEPLFHALHHTQRLFGTRAPQDLERTLQDIRPNWIARQLMSALLNRALQPLHPSCDGPGSDFARWLLYIRSHYLRMPWYLIVPHLTRKAYMRYFPKDGKTAMNAGQAVR
ncbi:nucleotidyltransferase family protein [Polaromonas sp. C04]|uniref:nucleotidyltransferase domain-containing protein n=1 Tax=Polaromonas sp. C04 TaxID=1945857 RepID=UPI0009856B99|nr:nucleotidyltransferase family protein [Polaromonas sp. C04]OOG51156.1 hypothetical protein B0E49_16140 [Polaromonas sp. C04]